MAHVPGDGEPHKRKRIEGADDGGGGSPGGGGGKPTRAGGFGQGAPQPPHFGTAQNAPINYLSRSSYEKLRLIQGDGDALGQLLQLLAEYEGVLAREESFAVNLGGKLTAPRLIKAVESAFEGTIVTTPAQPPRTAHAVRWPDVIQYARASPGGYTVASLPGGGRACRFHLKGMQVEVLEDDWRLIATGALDGMMPEGALDEDEAAELATVEILEARLEGLARAAEELAARAKNLVFGLGGRKAGIVARGEKGSPRGFQAVNDGSRKRANTGRSGARSGEAGDLHADLLQQFNASTPSPNAFPRPIYAGPNAVAPHMTPPIVSPNHIAHTSYPAVSPTSRYPPIAPSGRLPAPVPPARKDPGADDTDTVNRPLIMSMVETLGKGDEIAPPCDRCRRLRLECVKHLTACQGCTRKHAKCTWKHVSEEEMVGVRAGRRRKGELRVETGVMRVEKREEGGRRSGEETPLSRMDIDAITTQDEAPRSVPGAGLPRDPNFLRSPTENEEKGSLSSPVPAQAGHA